MNDITDVQREAIRWLREHETGPYPEQRRFAIALLDSLPEALTNPQPALPTEPGAYHDARGTLMIIDLRGNWRGTYGDIINPELCPAPFTRLIPERPPVTLLEIACAYQDATNDHMIEDGIKAIATLVNAARA